MTKLNKLQLPDLEIHDINGLPEKLKSVGSSVQIIDFSSLTDSSFCNFIDRLSGYTGGSFEPFSLKVSIVLTNAQQIGDVWSDFPINYYNEYIGNDINIEIIYNMISNSGNGINYKASVTIFNASKAPVIIKNGTGSTFFGSYYGFHFDNNSQYWNPDIFNKEPDIKVFDYESITNSSFLRFINENYNKFIPNSSAGSGTTSRFGFTVNNGGNNLPFNMSDKWEDWPQGVSVYCVRVTVLIRNNGENAGVVELIGNENVPIITRQFSSINWLTDWTSTVDKVPLLEERVSSIEDSLNNVVTLTGNQIISGNKNFNTLTAGNLSLSFNNDGITFASPNMGLIQFYSNNIITVRCNSGDTKPLRYVPYNTQQNITLENDFDIVHKKYVDDISVLKESNAGNVDFNTITTSGNYRVQGNTNAPATSNTDWNLFVSAGGSGGVIQIARYYSETNTNVYLRSRGNTNVWSSWTNLTAGQSAGGGIIAVTTGASSTSADKSVLNASAVPASGSLVLVTYTNGNTATGNLRLAISTNNTAGTYRNIRFNGSNITGTTEEGRYTAGARILYYFNGTQYDQIAVYQSISNIFQEGDSVVVNQITENIIQNITGGESITTNLNDSAALSVPFTLMKLGKLVFMCGGYAQNNINPNEFICNVPEGYEPAQQYRAEGLYYRVPAANQCTLWVVWNYQNSGRWQVRHTGSAINNNTSIGVFATWNTD